MRPPSQKPTGPCELCGVKTSSNWRWIPARIIAPRLQSCNPCYVRVLKQDSADPSKVLEVLDACRARRRPEPEDTDDELDDMEGEEEAAPAATPIGQLECLSAVGAAAHHGSPNSGASATRAAAAAAAAGDMLLASELQLPMEHAGAWQQPQQLQPPPLWVPPLASTAVAPQQQSLLQPQSLSAQLQRLQLLQAEAAGSSGASPAFRSPQTPVQHAVSPHGSGQLPALQDASWHQLSSPQSECGALLSARIAACQLPGVDSQLLAALPAVWYLDPHAGSPAQPAGVLLLSVHLPTAIQAAGLQVPRLRNGLGLQRALRVVVQCRQTGQVLQHRDWVRRAESTICEHPHLHVPSWDSGDGWQLLFPLPSSDTTQAQLFSDIIEGAGAAPPVAADARAFTLDAGAGHFSIFNAEAFHSAAAAAASAASAAQPQLQLRMPMLWPGQAWQQEAVSPMAALPLSPALQAAGQAAALTAGLPAEASTAQLGSLPPAASQAAALACMLRTGSSSGWLGSLPQLPALSPTLAAPWLQLLPTYTQQQLPMAPQLQPTDMQPPPAYAQPQPAVAPQLPTYVLQEPPAAPQLQPEWASSPLANSPQLAASASWPNMAKPLQFQQLQTAPLHQVPIPQLPPPQQQQQQGGLISTARSTNSLANMFASCSCLHLCPSIELQDGTLLNLVEPLGS